MDSNTEQVAAASQGIRRRLLYRQTLLVICCAGALLLAANVFAANLATLGLVSALTSLGIYCTVAAIVMSRILAFHPHDAFGWPNTVTLGRTLLAALIAGYTAEVSQWMLLPSDRLAWTFALLALAAVGLDGLDGWLARKVGPRSAFGARFDMESDAMLIMILSVLAVLLGKAGIWLLLTGLLRYAFVGASYPWPWLAVPLPDSLRRQANCIVQSIGLSALAMPVVSGAAATVLAASLVVLNVASFLIDILWLHRRRKRPEPA